MEIAGPQKASVSVTRSVLSTSVPPAPPSVGVRMASRALRHKLSRACWSSPESAKTCPASVVQGQVQHNVLADQGSHQFRQIADDEVGVGAFGLDRRAAAEAEQLSRQRRGPVGRFDDLLQVAVALLLGGKPFHGAARVAADDLQKIIELVGDPSRQLPYALQLLRLAEFFFGVVVHNDLGGRVRQVGQEGVVFFGDGVLGEQAITPVVLPRASCSR